MRGQTDRSPVAAGGIVSFHARSIAVWLQDHDRLCDSLIPSVRNSSPNIFIIGTPDLSTRNLRSVPCILLSGLSSLQSRARIRIPMYKRIIPNVSKNVYYRLYHKVASIEIVRRVQYRKGNVS